MKIAYSIFLGFLIILILFSITTYINFSEAEKVNENSEWFLKSSTIVRNSNRFQRNILNRVSALRGYLFTGENHFYQAYDSAAIENQKLLHELLLLVPDTAQQGHTLREIQQLNDRWRSEFADPLVTAKQLAGTSDSSSVSFNKLYREKLKTGIERDINRALQAKFHQFTNYEFELREERKDALTRSVQQTRNVSFYLTTASILIGMAVAFVIAYRMSVRITRMVHMAEAITAGNYEVQTEDKGSDELSRLTNSLNRMAKVLLENITLLKRKNEELDQFAHIVSHDLKAPLRGIDNVVTWIEEDHIHELSPKVREYIELIRGRLIRAENLIRGLLSYARIGKGSGLVETINLNILLQDIRENISIKDEIQLNIQEKLPSITGERIPLQQVLSNLIGNAVKYHDKRGGSVTVSFADKGSHYEFSVADNGPGIAQSYHEKIFMIFQTLRERDSFESTGVGLAIVKKILDDRKQRITLISEPGKGSIFSFTWPKI